MPWFSGLFHKSLKHGLFLKSPSENRGFVDQNEVLQSQADSFIFKQKAPFGHQIHGSSSGSKIYFAPRQILSHLSEHFLKFSTLGTSKGASMKWFKHKVSGHSGERIKYLSESIGYHKAYACYFTLMELCAAQYDGKSTTFKLRTKAIREALRLRGNNLLATIQLMNNCSLTNAQQDFVDKDLWVIEWPEIAKIKDEYTTKKKRKSGQTPESVLARRRVKKQEGERGEHKKEQPLSSTKKFDLSFDESYQSFEKYVLEHTGMTPAYKSQIPDIYVKWKDHPDDFNAFIQTRTAAAQAQAKNPEQVKAYVRKALLDESGVTNV